MIFCSFFFFFFNDTATTEIYTLSLHDALPIFPRSCIIGFGSSPSRCGPEQNPLRALLVGRGTSRFPYKKLLHMPGSATTPGRPGARDRRARAYGLPHSELCRHPG